MTTLVRQLRGSWCVPDSAHLELVWARVPGFAEVAGWLEHLDPGPVLHYQAGEGMSTVVLARCMTLRVSAVSLPFAGCSMVSKLVPFKV